MTVGDHMVPCRASPPVTSFTRTGTARYFPLSKEGHDLLDAVVNADLVVNAHPCHSRW